MRDNRTIKILLIEDDPNDVELIREYLRQSRTEFEIIHSSTVTDGLSRFEKEKESVDVVVLDLALPNGAGFGLFVRVQSTCSDCPIVVLTGHGDGTAEDPFADRVIRAGAFDYIHKNNLNRFTLVRSLRYAVASSEGEREKARADRLEVEVRELKKTLESFTQQLDTLAKGFNSKLQDLGSDISGFGDVITWARGQMEREHKSILRRKWRIRITRQTFFKIASGGAGVWLLERLIDWWK